MPTSSNFPEPETDAFAVMVPAPTYLSSVSLGMDDDGTDKVAAPTPRGGALDFFGSSAEGLAAIFSEEPAHPRLEPGGIIGSYRLIAKIADGGFGTVWRAEQQEPVVREVALKLVRPDKASPEVISRFERERQALAMMDHENIATVYDAGEHEGQLFFAMEYVPGQPITTYVKEHALSLKQRVELFIPVCRAVHHAHSKLILHRDLKPSNILVTLKDGKPVPKVIDFGIAKALTEDHAILRADTGTFPVTQVGYVLGTPQYMSPEQARGDNSIDASSDTYTLGVILYELLVGEPPICAADLAKQRGHFDLLNLIIKHEPALPSTLWLHASISHTHSLDMSMGKDSRRISRQMREDLDWIILHSLEKDRTHRYRSADALADDLQRHLNNEPVSVGPPQLGYRFRKFYLRNKVTSIAATLVFLSIIAGGSIATWQRNEALVAKNLEATARQNAENANAAEVIARQQAQTSEALAKTREKEAEQARDLEAKARALAEDQRLKAEAAREQEARARRASDLARAEAEDLINFMLYDMRDRLEPLNRSPMLATIADKAEAYFTAQATTLGDNPEQARNRAAMYQNKGLIELAQSKTAAALTSFKAFLTIAQARAKIAAASEEIQSDLALAHNRLGMTYQAKADFPAAQNEYQQEQAIVATLLKAKPDSTAYRLHLATTHEHLGDVSKPSLPHYQQALEVLEKLSTEQPTSIEITRALATTHEKMGTTLRALNQPMEALPHFDQQLALLDRLPAALATDVRIRRAKAIALQAKGATLLLAKKAADALPLLAAAVKSSQAIADADPGNQVEQADLASALAVLSTCHWELGQTRLMEGNAASIKVALGHFQEGRDAIKKSLVINNEERTARRAQLQRFEVALDEVGKLTR